MKSFLVVLCLFGLLACVNAQTIYDYLHTTNSYGFYVARISQDQNFESLLQNKSVNITVIAWKNTALDVWGNITLDGLKYLTFLTRQDTFSNATLYQTALQQADLLGEHQRILVTEDDGTLVYFNNFMNFHLNITAHTALDNGVLYEMADNIHPLPIPTLVNNTLATDPQFSTFWSLLQKFPNVLSAIIRPKLTIFAPNNFAFLNHPVIKEYLLNADHNEAQSILLNHIVDGSLVYSDMIPINGVPYQISTPSALINITRYPATTIVTTKTSHATVDEFDIFGENGVIISIDDFLFPDNFYFNLGSVLSAIPEASTFYNLSQDPRAKQFNDTLYANANMTLFAPDNDAFNNMSLSLNTTLTLTNKTLNDFLMYHLLPHDELNSQTILSAKNPHQLYTTGLYEPGIGRQQYINVQIKTDQTTNKTTIQINNANIVDHDLKASNGFIQVLDTVLTPPYSMSHVVQDIHNPEVTNFYGETLNILADTDIASTLLKTGRNLTFLIPTNNAWGPLAASGITEYLQSNINLTAYIIREHVLTNAVLYTNNLPITETVYKNLNGNNVTVRYDTSKHKVYVNDNATMDGPFVNILFSNGVGQLIDQVLIPHDVVFTTENVLTGLGYNSFVLAVQKAGYGSYLNRTNVTFLAANDSKWEQHVNEPMDQLRQTVQLNIIPQTVTSIVSDTGSVSYPTLMDGFSAEFIQGGQQARLRTPSGAVMDPVIVSAAGPRVVGNGAVIGVSDVFSFTYPPNNDKGDKLGAGMIVLIVFLVVFGVVALGAGGFFGYRYYKQRGQYQTIN
eukprot:TRINITY_DN793_c0_g1_i1.p1 TRINITY_DN793_c0_g1~~TRINITY_DN793_c0_g1_i1.p1  ORF type:complete len:792 (-),score=149.54 TRINITY_DN793_c0_g1_i1:58-2433(-)